MIRLHRKDEVNIYAEEQDARYATDSRIKKIVILAVICVVIFFLACILPTQMFNRGQFTLAQFLAEAADGVQNFIGVFVNPHSQYAAYFYTILVTLLAGGAMALSGGIFQGTLKNALASPSTLGVTSGGTIGIIIYTVFVYPSTLTATFNGSYEELAESYSNLSLGQTIIEVYGGFLCSLAGCAIIVFLIMSIALIAGRGKVSNVALVVAGQVFTALIALILNWVRLWLANHGDATSAAYLAQAQSITFNSAYTLQSVLVFAIPLIACMIIVFCMSGKLSLLSFNDEEARSMGLSTNRMRNFMVAICTIMTALVVSFCGAVGFVGFIVPFIARRLVGPDFRYLLPMCTLIGAGLVTLVFYITQMGIPYLVNGSTGVVTSLIGSVAFIVVALRGRRSGGGEWL
ncbi:MAG: iron ABC transporter permease [Eggerthellaceae bacterium]|nr:iron ABC transporter permease [Eggerthellaceae bacterium]